MKHYKIKCNKLLAVAILDDYDKVQARITEKGDMSILLDIDFIMNEFIELKKRLQTYEYKEAINKDQTLLGG